MNLTCSSSEDEGEEEETKQSTSQNKKTKKKSEIKDMFGMDLYTKGERTLAVGECGMSQIKLVFHQGFILWIVEILESDGMPNKKKSRPVKSWETRKP